jgi:transposase-like protein
MARPTKYSPEVEKRITDALAGGASRRLAAEYGGIHETTLIDWMHRYPNFASAVIRAEAQCEMSAVLSLRQGWMQSNDWRAGLEWLKRRRPKEWGDVTRHEIVNSVRELARASGADEDAAVAEAEAFLKEMRRGARS